MAQELDVINPATGRKLATIVADDAVSIADKLAEARAAQATWRERPFAERAEVVRRFGELLAKKQDTLARTLTSEVGKPLQQAVNEIKGTGARVEFFLAESESRLAPRTVLNESPALREILALEPLGVVANISAWNYPYFVGSNVYVPALLTGNAVMYKPSELAALSGRHMAELWWEAGLPSGLFQLIIGDAKVGAALLKQPVDGVFFTGSYATGKRIMEQVAGRMIKVQMELGGKDPVYVRADFDPKAAAEATADGAFYNAGQSCCGVERLYVHRDVYERFVEHFVSFARGIKMGDPMAEGTYLGPLTRPEQLAVLEAQVADALRQGARLLCGGKRAPGGGNYFEPTVLVDVDHRMAVMREESFGPIIGIMAVQDDAEAIRLMNDTDYGLTAGVYTKDEAKACEILKEVRAGTVYWNCCDRVSPRLPWSGRRHSGIGATLSVLGIDTFLQPKAWHMRGA